MRNTRRVEVLRMIYFCVLTLMNLSGRTVLPLAKVVCDKQQRFISLKSNPEAKAGHRGTFVVRSTVCGICHSIAVVMSFFSGGT